jgi:hypothetical protein
MATELELIHILKGIIKLLFEEKEALLNSDGHVVAEIVEKKNEYIEKLSAFKGIDIEKNEKVMSLIKEIDDLQYRKSSRDKSTFDKASFRISGDAIGKLVSEPKKYKQYIFT